jgi:hypothetical protein
MTTAVPALLNLATSQAIDEFVIVAGVWKILVMLILAFLQND